MAIIKNDQKTILIASLASQHRENLGNFLRRQGYSIVATSSGFHAMSLIEDVQNSFSLVFVIANLEDMSGQELLGLIRIFSPSKKKLATIFMPYQVDQDEILQIVEKLSVNAIVNPTNNMNIVLDKIVSIIGN